MLQHRFIKSARRQPDKIAFIDKSSKRDMRYGEVLIASLLLAGRLRKLEPVRIGVMLPTSAAGALTVIACLCARRTPVMINYSTGAARNCLYAQQQCDFRTIITTRSLLDKTGCERLPGMILIEDIFAATNALEKALAWSKSHLPLPILNLLCGKSDLDQPAVILFTSGSEKEPKVVQLTQL